MINHRFRFLGVGLVIIGLSLTGCGRAVKSALEPNRIASNGSVSGTVIVSADDLAQIGAGESINGAAIRLASLGVRSIDTIAIRNATTMPTANGTVYEIGDDGSVTATGRTFSVIDGSFSLNGLDPSKKYIVKIVKSGISSTGQPKSIGLTGLVVFDNDGSISVVVSEQTSVATDYIVQKVMSTGGAGLTNEMVAGLEDRIASAYAVQLTEGNVLRTGTIVDGDQIEEVAGARREWTLDAQRQSVVEAVDSDESVQRERKVVLIQSKVQSISADRGSIDDAKFVVRQIFGTTEGGSSKDGVSSEGPPEFFVQQFGEAALKNTTVTIADLASAIHQSIVNPTLKSYWTPGVLTDQIIHVLTASTSDVRTQYQVYDGQSTATLSPYLQAVFPNRDRVPMTGLTSARPLTVFQALYIVKSIGLVDGRGLPDDIRSLLDDANGPPFDPFKLLRQIEFMEIQDGHVYITEQRVVPVTVYRQINSQFRMVPAIDASIQLYGTSLSDVDRVVLDYPKQGGGTGRVVMNRMLSIQFASSPIGVASQADAKRSVFQRVAATVVAEIRDLNRRILGTAEVNQDGSIQEWRLSPWENQSAPTQTIDDYVSGTATIRVLNATGDVLDEKPVQIYRVELGAIQWSYPTGMDMAAVEETGWDSNFEAQVLAQEDGGLRPTLTWQSPAGADQIPDGMMLAYAVNLGLSVTKLDWQSPTFGDYPGIAAWDFEGPGYRYKNLWSTWQAGRYVTGTSIRLPIALQSTVQNSGSNYAGMYEVNVTPLLINKRTGAVVWQGKESRTSFRVGNTSPWSISIRGRITLSQNLMSRIGSFPAGEWKIGLFKTGSASQNGWSELFYKTGHKVPVMGPGNQLMVASLGQFQGYYVDYNLPVVTKTDQVLDRHANYRLVVWYDVNQTPDAPFWVNSGLQAEANKLELSLGYPLEYFEAIQGDIWVDQMGPRLMNGPNGRSGIMSGNPLNQVIDGTIGTYL